MKIGFRKLTAQDVEVRPTNTKNKGCCELLLYIDSRAAADILNEAVGQFGWTIEYKEVAGKTYGRLSIWDNDNQRWVFKEDTGSESNIEADKGLASDILKRCLARWGCDALYSAPRIKVKCPSDWYLNDKMTMTFYVSRISIDENNRIDELEIVNRFGDVVYSLEGKKADDEGRKPVQKKKAKVEEEPEEYDDRDTLDILKDFYIYYKDKIENGFEPRSFPALWKKWVESPNRNKK